MKIEKTIRLDDGQRIYVMGKVYPSTLNLHLQEYKNTLEWDCEMIKQLALRRYMRYHCDELSDWLKQYNCETTKWVNPNIYDAPPLSNVINFDWGIGFRHNDPKEIIFTLRWS